MRKLLIVVPLLILVLIVIDRAGVWIAEREIGARVQSAYGLPARPDVSVRSFPFLTQVASGNYQEIDVDGASEARLQGNDIAWRSPEGRFRGRVDGGRIVGELATPDGATPLVLARER